MSERLTERKKLTAVAVLNVAKLVPTTEMRPVPR